MLVKLTDSITVTEGKVVEFKGTHPSGPQFNGLARVVSAFMGSSVPSVPMVRIVSLADPTGRRVLGYAVDYAD